MVEVNAESGGSDPAPFVAHFLGSARGNVARGEIAETGILAFEVIIAVRLGDG